MRKNFRNAVRSRSGHKVWIRLDGGFSVRECRLLDQSSGGVRILIQGPFDVAGLFSLMMRREDAPGRRCLVKWRRGQEIGAEFAGASPGGGAR